MRCLPAALLLLLLVAGSARAEARRVWLDIDPGFGGPTQDIDDGLALILAATAPELELGGVSTVFGNAPLDEGHASALRLAARLDPELEVARGAASPDELGAASDATAAMARFFEAGEGTLLLLGPATNGASFFQRHPELAERVTEVICVAARRPGLRFEVRRRELSDFNFEKDPAAFEALLRCGRPLTFAGWEVASTTWLGKEEVAGFARSELPAVRSLEEAARGWLAFWRVAFGEAGFQPFDTLAIGWLIEPGRFTVTRGRAHIKPGEPPQLIVASEGEGPEVRYLRGVEGGFRAWLLARLARRSRPRARLY